MGDDVDEADRFLGFAVAGSGFAAKEEGPRRDLEFRVILQEVVQVQDVQDVQGLALVQVDALDLDVEDRVRPHVRIVAVADVAGQDFLAVLLTRVSCSWKAGSSAKGMRSWSFDGVRRQLSPMVSSMSDASCGLASMSQRRWEMPLVLFEKRCGKHV